MWPYAGITLKASIKDLYPILEQDTNPLVSVQVNFTTHCFVNQLESGAEFSTTEDIIYVSAFLLHMKHCEGNEEEEMQLFSMMFK